MSSPNTFGNLNPFGNRRPGQLLGRREAGSPSGGQSVFSFNNSPFDSSNPASPAPNTSGLPPVGQYPPPPPADPNQSYRSPDNNWQWTPNTGQYTFVGNRGNSVSSGNQFNPANPTAQPQPFNIPQGFETGFDLLDRQQYGGHGGPNILQGDFGAGMNGGDFPSGGTPANFFAQTGGNFVDPRDAFDRAPPATGTVNTGQPERPSGLPLEAQPGSLWHQRGDGTWEPGPPVHSGRPTYTVPILPQPGSVDHPSGGTPLPGETPPGTVGQTPLSQFLANLLGRGLTEFDPSFFDQTQLPDYNLGRTDYNPNQINAPGIANFDSTGLLGRTNYNPRLLDVPSAITFNREGPEAPTAINFRGQNVSPTGRANFAADDLLGVTGYSPAELPSTSRITFNPDEQFFQKASFTAQDLQTMGLPAFDPRGLGDIIRYQGQDIPEARRTEAEFSPELLKQQTGFMTGQVKPFEYDRFSAPQDILQRVPDYRFGGPESFSNQLDPQAEAVIRQGLGGQLGFDQVLNERLGDIAALNLRETYFGGPRNRGGIAEQLKNMWNERGLSQSGGLGEALSNMGLEYGNELSRQLTGIAQADAERRLANQQAAVGEALQRGQLSTQRGELGEEARRAEAQIADALRTGALGRLTGAYGTNLAGQQQAFAQQIGAAGENRANAALLEALRSGQFERQRIGALTGSDLYNQYIQQAVARSGEQRAQTGLGESLLQGALSRRATGAVTQSQLGQTEFQQQALRAENERQNAQLQDALSQAVFNRLAQTPQIQQGLENAFIANRLGISGEGRAQALTADQLFSSAMGRRTAAANTEQQILNSLFQQMAGASDIGRQNALAAQQIQSAGFGDILSANANQQRIAALRDQLAGSAFGHQLGASAEERAQAGTLDSLLSQALQRRATAADTEQALLQAGFGQRLALGQENRANAGLLDAFANSQFGRQRSAFEDQLASQRQALGNTLQAAGFNQSEINQMLSAQVALSGEDRANQLANAGIEQDRLRSVLSLLAMAQGQSGQQLSTLLGGAGGFLDAANRANQQGGGLAAQPGFWSQIMGSLIGGGATIGAAFVPSSRQAQG